MSPLNMGSGHASSMTLDLWRFLLVEGLGLRVLVGLLGLWVTAFGGEGVGGE